MAMDNNSRIHQRFQKNKGNILCEYLVKVRAQVMTRDESTEGWLPLAGGGLANVSIRKRAKLPTGSGFEYIIYGQRISDQNVILSCVINRDLKYYKVMPTFHHWLAGSKQRNGLTFQTAADARAFDKGIVRAYNELIEGLGGNNKKWLDSSKYESIGEDEVFMALDLPVETSENQSSPEGSGGSNKSGNGEKKSSIHYISCEKPLLQLCPPREPTSIAPGDNYSYVQLTAVNEYSYPISSELVASNVSSFVSGCDSGTNPTNVGDSVCNLKKRTTTDISGIGNKDVILKNLIRCRYCHEFYAEEFNKRGTCDFAPDHFKSGLECISGMCCARCMLYHCMRDSEGETVQHPCACANESGCTKRWFGLTLMSFIVPCLWCYPPLKACHAIGVSCSICGGKHKP